jgi:hypothetical protein
MRPTIKRVSLPTRETEDKTPRSQGELRLSLMRKLLPFINNWRACPALACRRHRRCASAQLECQKLPWRQHSPEQEQAIFASLKRALARRLANTNSLNSSFRPSRDGGESRNP